MAWRRERSSDAETGARRRDSRDDDLTLRDEGDTRNVDAGDPDVPMRDERDDRRLRDDDVTDRETRGGYVRDEDVDRREYVEDDDVERRPARRSVRDDDTVAERRRGAGIAAARSEFGGLDLPASLVGMLTALALLLLLAGLVSAAIGAVGYQVDVDVEGAVEGREQELSIGGLVGGVILLFIAFFVGGWAAGRIARYNGVLNGVMAAVWTLVLAAILSLLGAWFGSEYDVLRNVELPQWFSRDALTIGAIVSGLVAVLAMVGGAALGGSRGERYHREADAAVAGEGTARVR